ncbi:MAG: nucleotidyltransferase domain-containing protein [Candidatus Marsarchaeota archaeon]|nr:nucleotidyltransferase domain-containing protein [Candidatus Marsarchaeota archaeon]
MKSIEETDKIKPVDRQLLSDLKNLVLSRVPDATLLLYGSVARGDQIPESDYDILILLCAPISREQKASIRGVIYELELQHDVVMSIMYYTQEEWDSPLVAASPYRKNIEVEGMVI